MNYMETANRIAFPIELRAMRALAAYQYNTSGMSFFRDIFGEDHHPDYVQEWVELWCRSHARAIGKLDEQNFRKLCRIALERYGNAI